MLAQDLPFTLVGEIAGWDPKGRQQRIIDLEATLAPHVSTTEVAVGVVVLVKGRVDAMTGLRLVTHLRPWAV